MTPEEQRVVDDVTRALTDDLTGCRLRTKHGWYTVKHRGALEEHLGKYVTQWWVVTHDENGNAVMTEDEVLKYLVR